MIRILIILPFFKPLAVFERVSEKHLAAVLRHITSWTIGGSSKNIRGFSPESLGLTTPLSEYTRRIFFHYETSHTGRECQTQHYQSNCH